MWEYRAKCINVVDGDTCDLIVDLGFNLTFTLRVRLLGINTPEIRNELQRNFALLAKQALEKKLFSNLDWPLTLITHKSDSFGRWLGIIKIAGRDINKEMLAEGYAEEYK